MTRILVAALAGLAGLAVYLLLVLWAGDHVQRWHWALQLPFYVLAGFLWVFPVRRLMFWAAGARPHPGGGHAGSADGPGRPRRSLTTAFRRRG